MTIIDVPFATYDNRTRTITGVGTCSRAELSHQESNGEHDAAFFVAVQLAHHGYMPDQLYIDDAYVVRLRATDAIVQI